MNATLEYADGQLTEIDNLFVFAAELAYANVEYADDLESVAHALLQSDPDLVCITLGDGTEIEPSIEDYAAGFDYQSE